MIRIRNTDGSTVEVKAGQFVEIVNDLDSSVGLVFLPVRPGEVLQIAGGSDDAARYESMFRKQGVKFTPTIIDRAK